jgi:hypothetical protein
MSRGRDRDELSQTLDGPQHEGLDDRHGGAA